MLYTYIYNSSFQKQQLFHTSVWRTEDIQLLHLLPQSIWLHQARTNTGMLLSYGVDATLIELLMVINDEAVAAVRSGNELGEWFTVQDGSWLKAKGSSIANNVYYISGTCHELITLHKSSIQNSALSTNIIYINCWVIKLTDTKLHHLLVFFDSRSSPMNIKTACTTSLCSFAPN